MSKHLSYVSHLVACGVVLLLIGCLFFAPPSFADNYAAGLQKYNQGDYAAAKDLFLKAARENPTSYQIHYLLANTYMQLRQPENARTWYAICLKCNPDPRTVQNCRKALAYLQTVGGTRGSTAAPTRDTSSASKTSQADQPEEMTDAMRVAETRRKEILLDGDKQAREIRAAAEQRIKDLETDGNYMVRDMENNTVKLGVPGQIREQIMGEAEEQAKRVLEDAHKRAEMIQIPKR